MPTLARFADRLMELMPKLMREMHAYERNFFTEGSITLPQLWALDYLSSQGSCTMQQLSHAMHCGRPATTGLVDRMARLRLVRRERSRKDRRVVNVLLLPKGKAMVREIDRTRRRMTVRLFSRMTLQDRRQYLDIIERLVDQFAPAAQGPARRGGRR